MGQHSNFEKNARKVQSSAPDKGTLEPAILPLEPRIMLDGNLEWAIGSSTALTSVLSSLATAFDSEIDQLGDFLDSFDDAAQTATETIDMLVSAVDTADSVLGAGYDLSPAAEAIERIRAAIEAMQDLVNTSIVDLIDGNFASDVTSIVNSYLNTLNSADPARAYTPFTVQDVADVYTIENFRDGTVMSDLEALVSGGDLGRATDADVIDQFHNAVASVMSLPSNNFSVDLTDIQVDGQTIIAFTQDGANAVDVSINLPQAIADFSTLVNETLPGVSLPIDLAGAGSDSSLITFELETSTVFDADGNLDTLDSVGLAIHEFTFAPLVQVGGALTLPADASLNLGFLDLTLTSVETAQLGLFVETSADFDLGFTVDTTGAPSASWNGSGATIDVTAQIQEVGALAFVDIDGSTEYTLLEAELEGALTFGAVEQEFTSTIDLLSVLDGSGAADRLQNFLNAARFEFAVDLVDTALDAELEATLESAISSLATMGTEQVSQFLSDISTTIAIALRDNALSYDIPLTDISFGQILNQVAATFQGLVDQFTINPMSLGFVELITDAEGNITGQTSYDSALENQITENISDGLSAADLDALLTFNQLTFTIYGPTDTGEAVSVDLAGTDVLNTSLSVADRRQALADLLNAALSVYGFAISIAANGGLRISSTTPVTPSDGSPASTYNSLALTGARRDADGTNDDSVSWTLLGFDPQSLIDAADTYASTATGDILRFVTGTTSFDLGTMDISGLDGLDALRLTLTIDGNDVLVDVPATGVDGGFDSVADLANALTTVLADMGFGLTAGLNAAGDGLSLSLSADETRSFVLSVDPDDLLKAVDIEGLIDLVNTGLASIFGTTSLELTEDGALVFTMPDLAASLSIGADQGLGFSTDDLGLGNVTGLSLSALVSAQLDATLTTAFGLDLVGFGSDLIDGGTGNALENRSDEESTVTSALLDNVFFSDISLSASAHVSADQIVGSASVGIVDVVIGADDASLNFVDAAASLEVSLVGTDADGEFSDRITLRNLQDAVVDDVDTTGATPVVTSAPGLQSLLGRFELLGGIIVDGAGQGLAASGDVVTTQGDVQIVDPFASASGDDLAQLLVRLGDVKINVLGVQGLNEDLIDGISFTVEDLADLRNTFELALLSDNADLLDAIDGLSALSDGDILDSLVAIANILVVVGDTLSESLPFLDADIPLLNFSILDQINFASDFLESLQDIRNNPQSALDELQGVLESVFGQDAVTLTWDSELQTILFDLSFQFLEDYQQTIPFNLDLSEILGDQLADIVGPELADVVSGLVDVSGDGQLIFNPLLSLDFSFGIDLSPTLATPTDLAELTTALADLSSAGVVNLNPNGGNEIRIIRTNSETGAIERVEVNVDDAETVQDIVDAINVAVTNEFGSTVSFEFDPATGQITLQDSLAFATDDTGVTALFGADEVVSTLVGDVQTIVLDAGFATYADAAAFSLTIGGEMVGIEIPEEAGRDLAGFVDAFDAALATVNIDRTAISGSAIAGMSVTLSHLLTVSEDGGAISIAATNFTEANGFDAFDFSVSAQGVSEPILLRMVDLGGANITSVLGFDAGVDGEGELVGEALYQGVEIGAPRIFLDTEASGIVASFEAGVNDGLNIQIGLGPVSVQVTNGHALINAGDGSGDPAHISLTINDIDGDGHDGQYDLSHLFDIGDDPALSYSDLFGVDIAIGIDIGLPLSDTLGLFDPATDGLFWETSLLATAPDFSLSSFDLSDITGAMVDLYEGTGINFDDFRFELPDLSDFLANLNIIDLLNNPQLILSGLDMLLDQMQTIFDDYLADIDLPVIGDAIGAGVTFFTDFRYNVIQRALEYAQTPLDDGSLPTTVDLIVNFANEALNDLLDTTDVIYLQAYLNTDSSSADEAYVYAVLNFNATIFDEMMDIDFDLGIPGFDLSVEQGSNIRMALTYGVNIGFGYDRNGFFVLNDTDDAEVSVDFLVDAGTFEGSMSLLGVLGVQAQAVTVDSSGSIVSSASSGGGTAEITATLEADLYGETGLLIVDPNDREAGESDITSDEAFRDFTGVSPENALGQALSFERVVYVAQLDTGNLIAFDFVAAFDIQLGLEANVIDPTTGNPILIGGVQILPSVNAEILFAGEYSLTDGLNIEEIVFSQVRLDASVLYDAILAPVLDPINEFLAPVAELFSFLANPPISYITDILGNVFPIINLASSIISVVDGVLTFVDSFSTSGGLIIFGDFDFSGNSDDIESGEASVGTVDQRDISIGGNSNSGGAGFGVFGNPNSGFALEIPLLSDPFSAINLLTGNFEQVDLVRASYTLFNLDTGQLDIVGLVLDSIGAPGWVSSIIRSAFSATIEARLISQFEVGYDMSGIVNFVNSYDPERLLDGVFISSDAYIIDAYIGASMSLNLGIAGLTASGNAGIYLLFNDVDDDGKLRIPELIALLEAADEAGGGFLDYLGYLFRGEASYHFFLSVWAGISLPWPLPDLKWSTTVFDFGDTFPFGGLAPGPSLATDIADTGGTAILNIGARAGASFSDILEDGNDRVVINGPNSPFSLVFTSGGRTITTTFDENAGAIIIPAGEGNNTIDLSGVNNGIPTITYTGAGTDSITLPPSGLHVVFAGDGNDHITAPAGANGTYIIFGDGGADNVDIPGGNVVYFSDSDYGMRDLFMQTFAAGGVTEAAILSLLGLNLDGTIAAGGAANYISGTTSTTLTNLLTNYTESTQSRAENADETVTLGSGNHLIMMGAGDDVVTIADGSTGHVQVYAGAGADTIQAIGTDVFVEGGAGRDFIEVGGAAAEVWGWGAAAGESGLTGTDAALDALALRDGADMLIGGSSNDTLHGQLGDDILLGGFGNDSLTGGLDNDIIAGGNMLSSFVGGASFDIQTFDINAPLTFGLLLEAEELADGDDTIDGGSGDDLMAGGGGSDSINGDTGNDILLGDFGQIQLSSNWIAERVVSTSISSTFSGTDQLSGGAGNDILMAGAALAGESEALIDLLGNNTMIGDFADVSGARVLEGVTSLISIETSEGGADSIETGRGNDLILGGEGDDTISSGLGGDLIFGDNGVLDITAGTMVTTGGDSDGNDLITIGTDPAGAGDPPSPTDIRDIVIGGRGDDTVNAIDGGLVFIGDAGTVTLDAVALSALRTFRPAGSNATQEQIEDEERALQLISNIASALESSAHVDDGDDSISITGGDATAVLGGGSDIAELSLADGISYVLGDDGTLTIVPNDDYSGRLTTLTTAASAAAVNDDQITAGNGDNLIVGGEGLDAITLGDGDNQVLGDSGTITHDNRTADETSVLVSASQGTDGNDTIIAGDGRNRVLSGGGADDVTLGHGGNLVMGDSGTISDVPTGVELTSSDPLIGGNDTVVAGDGDDIVLLGAGADHATLNEGNNIVLGDNGSILLTYDADGDEVVLTSQTQTSDGDDIVTAGNGRNRVVSGGGADDVTLGDGGNLVIGDSGILSDLNDQVLLETRDPEAGGNDSVTTGSGDDIVILGGGDDVADLGNGNNTAVSDNGTIDFVDAGISTVSTGSDANNGNDTVTTGTGRDVVLGGLGDDSVTTDAGRDVVLGDMGIVAMNAGLAGGISRTAETTVQGTGGADVIDTGGDADVVLAGANNDTVTSGAGEDVVLGDDGQWTASHMNGLGVLTGAVMTTGGDDSIDSGTDNDLVIAGQGNDNVFVDEGDDVALGDDGVITFRNDTDVETLVLTNEDLGGDDTISATATDGDNILIGQAGADTLTGGNDDDILLGDVALITFDQVANTLPGQSTADRMVYLENIRPDLAFDDLITGEAGADLAIGGFGADTMYGGDGQDFLIGDTAIITREWVQQGGAIVETLTLDTNFAFEDGGLDIIHGDDGPNVLIGNLGPDLFFGNTADDLIFSDGYAGIFRSQSTDQGFAGPTEQMFLFTSNFAGFDAVDIVSASQQSDAIGAPLSVRETLSSTFGPDPSDGLSELLFRNLGQVSSLVDEVMALLATDRYVAAIAALSAANIDTETVSEALYQSLLSDLSVLMNLDGASYELLLRRMVAMFVEQLENADQGEQPEGDENNADADEQSAA